MKRKIVYLDTFCSEHSGRFWLKAFEEHGEVWTFDVGGLKNPSMVVDEIVSLAPDHIHFGGSTQSEKTFKLTDIERLKKIGATVTFFYGDGYYRWPYFSQLAGIVDRIFVTNRNLCQKPNIYYTLCPAPKEMAVDYKVKPD